MQRTIFCLLVTLIITFLQFCKQKERSKKLYYLGSEEVVGGEIIPSIPDQQLDSILTSYSNSGYQIEHKNELLKNIRHFDGRVVDTLLIQVGNLDNLQGLDTIYTHIYFDGSAIQVGSKWIKNGNVLWKYQNDNPFAYINEVISNSTNLWIYLTNATLYNNVELYDTRRINISESNTKYWFELDTTDVAFNDFYEYAKSFSGSLLLYGDPETRNELLIWYEPVQRFFTYYRP